MVDHVPTLAVKVDPLLTDGSYDEHLGHQWRVEPRELAIPLDAGDRAEEAQAIAELAKRSGDRVRDINEGLRRKVAALLQALLPGEEGDALSRAVQEVVPRKEREERFAFGDSLPAGLRLVSADG